MLTADVSRICPLRTVFAALRPARLRRCNGHPGRAARSRTCSPTPSPVTRAATTPSDTAPHGAAAVTGSPGPVVPLQRGHGATGPAHTSVNGADAPSRATRQGRKPSPVGSFRPWRRPSTRRQGRREVVPGLRRRPPRGNAAAATRVRRGVRCRRFHCTGNGER